MAEIIDYRLDITVAPYNTHPEWDSFYVAGYTFRARVIGVVTGPSIDNGCVRYLGGDKNKFIILAS